MGGNDLWFNNLPLDHRDFPGVYRKTRTIPGQLLKSSILQESQDACKPCGHTHTNTHTEESSKVTVQQEAVHLFTPDSSKTYTIREQHAECELRKLTLPSVDFRIMD